MTSSAGAARAIADVTGGTILASVDIMVPPGRVFAAITEGDEIVRWWGSPQTYTTTGWATDFRVGGKWRAEGVSADGVAFHVEGEFIEIERPWRVTQTWLPSWEDDATTLTYQLSAIEGGTRLVIRHEGFRERQKSCESHSAGWIQVLSWLAADIGPKPGPDTSKYFLARLLGPRPDFARTLSAEELAMMQAHAKYWMPMLESGKVIVLGPVNDPKWTWGLGVMKVDSEEELLQLQSHDPAIVQGRGTSYENIPMFLAAYRRA